MTSVDFKTLVREWRARLQASPSEQDDLRDRVARVVRRHMEKGRTGPCYFTAPFSCYDTLSRWAESNGLTMIWTGMQFYFLPEDGAA